MHGDLARDQGLDMTQPTNQQAVQEAQWELHQEMVEQCISTAVENDPAYNECQNEALVQFMAVRNFVEQGAPVVASLLTIFPHLSDFASSNNLGARTARLCTMRLKIIGNEIIKNVGESESCMVSELPIIFKRTRKMFGVQECAARNCVGMARKCASKACGLQLAALLETTA